MKYIQSANPHMPSQLSVFSPKEANYEISANQVFSDFLFFILFFFILKKSLLTYSLLFQPLKRFFSQYKMLSVFCVIKIILNRFSELQSHSYKKTGFFKSLISTTAENLGCLHLELYRVFLFLTTAHSTW